MTAIVDVHARQILDSRGNPTVEVDVTLEDGSMGRAAVPSGASTGAHEAVELRDGDKGRWGGKGVEQGGRGGQRPDRRRTRRLDAEDQAEIDAAMIALDGTREQGPARRQRDPRRQPGDRQGRGGRARAAALPLRRRGRRDLLPVPMMNILNGGAHADNRSISRNSWSCRSARRASPKALRCGAEIFHALKGKLHEAGLSTAVGDEGGFAPDIARRAKRSISSPKRCSAAGYKLGKDVLLALDCAASEYFKDGDYRMDGEGKTPVAAKRMADFLAEPGARLSDRLDRGRHGRGRHGRVEGADREARRHVPAGRRRPVRDQRRARWPTGFADGIANSILIKVNQIGTLTETIDAVRLAQTNGYTAVMSHRSGETEDSTIADLAVALVLRADQDRQPGALGPHRQVQPAAADRGGAGRAARYPGRAAMKAYRPPDPQALSTSSSSTTLFACQPHLSPCVPVLTLILSPMGGEQADSAS